MSGDRVTLRFGDSLEVHVFKTMPPEWGELHAEFMTDEGDEVIDAVAEIKEGRREAEREAARHPGGPEAARREAEMKSKAFWDDVDRMTDEMRKEGNGGCFWAADVAGGGGDVGTPGKASRGTLFFSRYR